jgi:hypothetical protein
MRRVLFILIIAFAFSSMAAAQTGSQFCLRAYEDRNGNSQFDSSEPFITRGVSVNLLNAENIIVASALMDDSPNAAQGVICFQFLTTGQYSLTVTSADFTATTPDTFTASIGEGTLPTVVEYGAQRSAVEPVVTPSSSEILPADQRDMLQRIVLSGLGTLLVVAGMIVLGVFIYLIAFRNRAAPAPERTPTTGSIPPVKMTDTAEIKKI